MKLEADLERDLELHCRAHRLTKSEVVTRLIRQYLALQEPQVSPFELAKRHRLIGAFSGPRNLAAGRKRYIRRMVRAKHAG